ncbi:MAG: type IV toxin-antitoxin system AbiEi family antitoxin domain-containing protein [Myxococcota bacterium]
MPSERTNHQERVLSLADQRSVIRARDLDAIGVPRTVLSRLVDRGELLRVERGLYMRPDADVGEHHTLVEVARRVPRGVVNLLSALAFHGLTDEAPHAVWLALPRNARTPAVTYPSLDLTWTSAPFLELGVDTHEIEGVAVRVTGPARTVADAFKYRSRVGQDVAIAALRDYLRLHRGGVDELWAMAEATHVRTVVRPFLEALS